MTTKKDDNLLTTDKEGTTTLTLRDYLENLLRLADDNTKHPKMCGCKRCCLLALICEAIAKRDEKCLGEEEWLSVPSNRTIEVSRRFTEDLTRLLGRNTKRAEIKANLAKSLGKETHGE